MKQALLLTLFCLFFAVLPCEAADEYLQSQFDQGLTNADTAAYLLFKQARTDKARASELLRNAVEYSPDLPKTYFELARSSFSFSLNGILSSFDYMMLGFDAYSRNFRWSFSFGRGLFSGFFLSLALALFILAVIRMTVDLPLLSHEMEESRANTPLFFIVIIVSALSPFAMLASVMVLIGLYLKRFDRIVVYCALVALLLSPVFFRVGTFFSDASVSGRLKAAVDVNEDRDNGYALATLSSSTAAEEVFSYALALKRTGRYDEALALYLTIPGGENDPKVLVNIGNCLAALEQYEEALTYYERAYTLRPLASAYYNHSQIARELFAFNEGETSFRKALEIDARAVSAYRKVSGRNPNRLVVDETLSLKELYALAWRTSATAAVLRLSIMPPWFLSVAAVLLAAGLIVVGRQSGSRAHRCKRCGTIQCSRCSQGSMWGQMCPSCFRSLIKLDELEVRERVSNLLMIYERQKRRRAIMKILVFLLPGGSQIYAGRVLAGFCFLWLFLFCAITSLSLARFSYGGMSMHMYAAAVFGLAAAAVYIISILVTKGRMARGWL